MQYEPSPENGAAEWKVESTAAFLVEKKREKKMEKVETIAFWRI